MPVRFIPSALALANGAPIDHNLTSSHSGTRIGVVKGWQTIMLSESHSWFRPI